MLNLNRTFFDFQHRQKAAFSAISSMSTKSATLASSKRTALLTRVTLTDLRASGQNAMYDIYPRPATAAVGGTKLIQSRTVMEKNQSTKQSNHVLNNCQKHSKTFESLTFCSGNMNDCCKYERSIIQIKAKDIHCHWMQQRNRKKQYQIRSVHSPALLIVI